MCNEILRQGIFDEIIIDVEKSISENVSEWLHKVDYGQFKSKQNSGLKIGFPIEGVPVEISGNHSEDEFNKWKTALGQGKTRQFNESEAMLIVARTASETIVNAWLKCLDLTGPGLKTSVSDNGDNIVFTARWVPNSIDDYPPHVTDFSVAGATYDNGFSAGMEIPLGGRSIHLKRNGTAGVDITLNTDKGTQTEQLPPLPDPPIETRQLQFNVRIFEESSELATAYPKVEVNVPEGYKIIGGGAKVNWIHPGNHLIESYPESTQKWIASARESQAPAPSTINTWAIALEDPNDEWEVEIFQDTSDVRAHPNISKQIPENYILTGGGAKTHKGETNAGNFLTASFPRDSVTWEARSKDHNVSSPASLTVYAIGIKPKNGVTNPYNSYIVSQTSNTAEPHPAFEVSLGSDFIFTGGGALLNWNQTGSGNLLTASYPNGTNIWRGEGKDHFVPSPSTITVYAIGVRKL